MTVLVLLASPAQAQMFTSGLAIATDGVFAPLPPTAPLRGIDDRRTQTIFGRHADTLNKKVNETPHRSSQNNSPLSRTLGEDDLRGTP